MPRAKVLASCLTLGAILLAAGNAGAIGFVLSESKEELKLGYDVTVTDHGTGRVTVVLTLADEGRLAPLDEVQLVIPAQETNADGGRWMDLVVSIEMTKTDDGKRVGRVHLLRELAERASLQLNTHTLDGKIDPLTRLHHVISIDECLKKAAAAGAATSGPRREPIAPPATERTRR